MKYRWLGILFVAACAPRDPYAGYPTTPQAQSQPANGGYQYTNDPAFGACQQQANQELATCNGIAASGKNTSSAWQLRADYNRIAQTCPAHAHDGIVGQLEACVTKLESFELQQDPDAPKRRETAKARVADTRAQPEFKQLLDEWTRALDGKNISCRDRDVDDSHARDCERRHGELQAVEDRLAKYLEGQGYDRRDVDSLGLWPHDPDWRTSPN